jgi:GNAT superfamily N-acetyltransferase
MMTKNELMISKAAVEDLPGVLKLYSQEDIDNGDVLSLDDARAMYYKFSRYPDYNVYVVKIGGMIVGTFALLVMDNLAHAGKPSAIIEDIVVDEQYRSRGIGSEMIENAMRICRERGCYKLALSSNSKRKRAHRFYQKLGFKKHGYSFVIEV